MGFNEEIMTLLHEYKHILKRYFKPEDRAHKIQELSLQRKSIKNADEIALYHKAHHVINDIKSWINDNNSPTAYSGIEEFCQHLTDYLSQHRIETSPNGKEKIINTRKLVSRAMVDAIQLLSLPTDQLSSKKSYQLEKHLQTIAQYGNKEQQELLIKTLKNRKQQHTQITIPFIDTLKGYMQTRTLLREQL